MKKEKGQNLVEFALLLPIFLLILVGIAEFGRAWMTKNILTGAAREGARAAVVQADFPTSQSLGDNTAKTILGSAGITTATVTVWDPSLPIPSIQVDVQYTYPVFLLGFIPGLPANITLNGTATMRRERY